MSSRSTGMIRSDESQNSISDTHKVLQKRSKSTDSSPITALYSPKTTNLTISNLIRLSRPLSTRRITMAWRSSGATNTALIENLFSNGLIKSIRVKDAMLNVDRGHYAPREPYADTPQYVGHHATISAPHMHAHACEALLSVLKPNGRVLDVGSGSGYLTHVLANLVEPDGEVIGIEHIEELAREAKLNMGKSDAGRELMRSKRVRFICRDGREGFREADRHGDGYDAIHVGAAAKGWPEELVEQLKNGGRMFIPIEEKNGEQNIWIVDKDEDGQVERKKMFGVQYVPLTDAPVSPLPLSSGQGE
ncbi:PCMT-domain-containing protein [Microthyrium microscopicum]|uniref:protein-L-isoaspartate(D-aspartate) O-methyltransferase n=1 Tax=Microthyrium microscopicum TaxID=703497 RepID=A0A6A6TW78_9PEZI|nr:PCMT-domain-containing protein [Microthyrium microscopicum]